MSMGIRISIKNSLVLTDTPPSPVFLYSACNLNEIPSIGKGRLLLNDLAEAQRLEADVVVVVNYNALQNLRRVGSAYQSESIPQDAILNLNPYAPPRAVTAAGGLVRHRGTGNFFASGDTEF